jgi:hypothetical protein
VDSHDVSAQRASESNFGANAYLSMSHVLAVDEQTALNPSEDGKTLVQCRYICNILLTGIQSISLKSPPSPCRVNPKPSTSHLVSVKLQFQPMTKPQPPNSPLHPAHSPPFIDSSVSRRQTVDHCHSLISPRPLMRIEEPACLGICNRTRRRSIIDWDRLK